MPMLLEDLAEEAAASNRRVADRLDKEVRDLDARRQATAVLDDLRQKAVESARQATASVVSRAAEADNMWRSALDALRKKPSAADAERLLRNQLALFESGRRLVRLACSLWSVSRQMGVTPERLDELDAADRRFDELSAEARLALEHRAGDWQPADPARLALGLELARQGKTVRADEARARFRRDRRLDAPGALSSR
jgi:hypothetical protein